MKKILIYMMSAVIIGNIFYGCNNVKKEESKETTAQVSYDNEEIESIDEGIEGEREDDPINENRSNGTINVQNEIEESTKAEEKKYKKTVVIDPGHASHSNHEKEKISPDSEVMKIKDGGGAEGVSTKTPEYKVAMAVALKLKPLLEEKGVNVIMTKTSHEQSLGNIERAEVGNSNNADLEIRIHCDSAESQSAKGASMLVPAKVGYAANISDVSRNYGEIILKNVVGSAGMNNRGIVEREDLTGFNWSKVPVVLIEMGFMSNPEEDKLLSDDSYQNKLAEGMCNGIIEALKL